MPGPSPGGRDVAPHDERSVPDLLRDLFRAVLGLGRNTARMLACEARELAPRVARRLALVVAAAVTAAVGLLLVLGGLALVLEQALDVPRWASLTMVGLVALVAGGLGTLASLRRLVDPGLVFPETLAEVSKDVDHLTGSAE